MKNNLKTNAPIVTMIFLKNINVFYSCCNSLGYFLLKRGLQNSISERTDTELWDVYMRQWDKKGNQFNIYLPSHVHNEWMIEENMGYHFTREYKNLQYIQEHGNVSEIEKADKDGWEIIKDWKKGKKKLTANMIKGQVSESFLSHWKTLNPIGKKTKKEK